MEEKMEEDVGYSGRGAARRVSEEEKKKMEEEDEDVEGFWNGKK